MHIKWLRIISGLIGLTLALLMVFANELGLAAFPTWGVRRTILLLSGLSLLTGAFLYKKENFLGWLIHTPHGHFALALMALNAGILLTYLWFGSDGLWKPMHNETNYYDLQANAFAKGQLELDVKPDPALLAFTDESLYEPENRTGIPTLWDATLYNGKYYLYWGPAPALLLTPLKLIYKPDLGDKLITFVFMAGLLLFLNLIILNLWKHHFAHLPHRAVLAAVALAGLANPMPYIMVEGRIYEAAIVAAQFFFAGGLYFLFSAFNNPSLPRLATAGTFFILAIGSRTTLLPAVGIIAILLLLWALQTQRTRLLPTLLAFALPIAIGGLLYATYNYARFGSPTEFGYTYQLTSYNLYQRIGDTFDPAYIPPNLYKTILNPLEKRTAFPYLFPTRWAGPQSLTNYQPNMYLTYTENITGLLISTPFALLAILAFLKPQHELRWVNATLSAAFLLPFITLQAFFFIAMRYMLDATPALTLLTIIGYWHGFKLLNNHKAYLLLTTLLLIYTLILSLLISFAGNLELFKIHNMEMIQNLTWVFNTLIIK